MVRKGWWVLLLVLVTVGVAGCGRGSDEVVLDETDSGREIRLAPGQTLVIRLESNPSTGYSWGRTDTDSTILVQEGEAEYSADVSSQNRVGAGGVETLRFKAAQAGETSLELGYRRVWEEGVDPIQTFQVQVTVQ